MEPQYGSNLAKTQWLYVPSGLQPCQETAGRILGWIWNRTEPF